MLLECIFTVISFYSILSYIFLRRPEFIHKIRKSAFDAGIIGHRGGSGEVLENTIDGFHASIALGCDVIELDCHLTKDKEVVVSHDDDLLRATGHQSRIAELNFCDLPPYLGSLKVQFGHGAVFCAKPAVSRSIPLLRTVFEAFPATPINIDVKTDSDELIGKISDLVEEFKREDITVWGSFSDAVVSKCRARNPRIPTFFPIKRVLWVIGTYLIGLLPFLYIQDDFFEIPLVNHFFQMPNIVQLLKAYISRIPILLKCGRSDDDLLKLITIVADKLLMRPKLFAHLKARGIPVFVWVCNESIDFDRVFSTGATGIVTDYPSRALAYLDEHPEFVRGANSALKANGAARRFALSGVLDMKRAE